MTARYDAFFRLDLDFAAADLDLADFDAVERS